MGDLVAFQCSRQLLSFTRQVPTHKTLWNKSYSSIKVTRRGKPQSTEFIPRRLNFVVLSPVETDQRVHNRSVRDVRMSNESLPKKDKDPSFAASSFRLYKQLTNWATLLYPIWILAASLLALFRPSLFSRVSSKSISWALSVLMFSVGSTLSLKDFIPVLKTPLPVLLGFIGCYVLMPFLSVFISRCCNFHYEYYAGMILLGCVSGGQASNLSTYVAKGDVALSVAMTTISTLASVFMLPALSKLFLGTVIPINAIDLSKSTAEVVLAPILLGMFLHSCLPRLMYILEPALPLFGVVATMYCVVGALSKVQNLILSNVGVLFLPVMLLHFVGGIAGYYIPKWLGLNEKVCRTLSIETCFKSPALSYVLATKHFSAYGVRMPSAVSILVLAPLAAFYSVILRFLSVRNENN
ncbi:hypothetical protein GpartN1_g6521.t1 [Galdieria partita]|uniref:Uncharacterized protein n=1 Tax=Galdieria partita TaxID=83374 RepID=A0A9C7Q2K1_9RHOD|nr:hypothetical protein GpartN1_g6521.t1 [Galdieria partita]